MFPFFGRHPEGVAFRRTLFKLVAPKYAKKKRAATKPICIVENPVSSVLMEIFVDVSVASLDQEGRRTENAAQLGIMSAEQLVCISIHFWLL